MSAAPQHADVPVPVNPAVVERWYVAHRQRLRVGGESRRVSLAGGVASPIVERVEFDATGPDGASATVSVVAKRATAAELVALRELAALTCDETFTEVVAVGVDAHGPWAITPFYPGPTQHWDAEPPPQVYASLARLHLRCLPSAASLPVDLPRVDHDLCRGALVDFAPAMIRRANRQAAHPVHDRALRLLAAWADDPRMYAGIDLLPPTLLHGDMYGANVLMPTRTQRRPRLVDWGSARVGPAMLDVALAAGRHSVGLDAYLRAWQDAAGAPLDPWQADAGHAWARAFNDAMFVGAVASRFGPEPAADMLDDAEAALARFGHLLDARPR